ncbi:DNA-formamidopyrimidine glycosylase [Bacillus sp. FJAT-49736]|uniref:DNA-formamidopyrimidine glycosylase n=1 Tax=Bacillus sp. FJAT-49736 TaxID=2833582 RepID=UPI001BC91171|nr:DNA-formamidopyrimidine glycosylase [Bacillus sp. FJAT-49736]MBS4173787.1 DNA-formamidopyrimidine glycosylase [Bacillus sp. FJAT-49736]
MPELPEVETIKRTLTQLVLGRTIKNVIVHWPKIIKKPDEKEQFIDALAGQSFEGIDRKGKFLIFYTDDFALVSHLRMEGRYGLYQHTEPIDKHTHIIFQFTDGTELRYRDVRKFGTMHLFKKGEEFSSLPLLQLGPEPFSNLFTNDYLKEKLSKTDRNIKAVLLDQTVIAGLGNIYVDEALYRAKIHPERKSRTLTYKEINILRKEIIATLEEAVEKGGSTVRTYVNTQGQIGMFQLQHFVYGKKGEPCQKCGTLIEKRVTAGRGTHFCPKCQRL